MPLMADIARAIKAKCPVCGKGRLFKAFSVTVVDQCDNCGEKLSGHDIGDGAAVFFIFLFGFTIVPIAWGVELAFAPPMWVHVVMWTAVMLLILAVLLPAIKAYIILLEYRHRK